MNICITLHCLFTAGLQRWGGLRSGVRPLTCSSVSRETWYCSSQRLHRTECALPNFPVPTLCLYSRWGNGSGGQLPTMPSLRSEPGLRLIHAGPLSSHRSDLVPVWLPCAAPVSACYPGDAVLLYNLRRTACTFGGHKLKINKSFL